MTTLQPSAHTQRYDRQLRLWASSGQSSLEKAHLLVVGASALSAQILKNLVLPGIGAFTIVDDAIVDGADLGVNFFLQPGGSEAKPAASEMARLLAEMNDGVSAHAKLESPAALLAREPSFFTGFSLVISVNQPHSFDLALSDLCWALQPPAQQVPFLRVRSAGMMGQMTVSLKQLGLVETHPDSVVDLRLTRPFAELEALADSFDLDTDDSMLHSHIPFVVILLKKLAEWKQKNGGSLPTTANRADFVALINASRRPDNADEENFDEAIAALGKHVWRPISSDGAGSGGVPSEVRALFDDPECQKVGPCSNNFWLLVRALRDFVAASPTDSLPLSGSLPDMKATSDIYVRLQSCYRAKAASDLAEFAKILEAVAAQAGVAGAIGQDEVEAFVKHAGYLKLIRGRSERQRFESPNAETATMAFMDPVNPCTFQHHIALLASDRFYELHGRYPGSSAAFSRSITSTRSAPAAKASLAPATRTEALTSDSNSTGGAGGEETRQAKRHKSETPTGEGDGDADVRMLDAGATAVADNEEPDLEKDETALLALAGEVAAKFGAAVIGDEDNWEKVDNAVRELVRSGHASLPATMALLGGMVAQETIKLITRQYIPADNTVVYDGIQQAIGVFRL
ncbi:hypothetical protein ACQY0O_008121 [Thecaphora frezii]